MIACGLAFLRGRYRAALAVGAGLGSRLTIAFSS